MKLKSLILALTAVGAMAMPVFYAAPAQAQATRTWVSGVGSDANPCSRTAPCKTWAGAISKTAPGGEIDALDPGGYGAVTITMSMTLDGGGGQVASTLVGGSNGIVVAAGATDVVVIRNVRLQGVYGNGTPPAPGLSAIVFNSGKSLTVDNCDITGFSVNGITIAATGGFAAINNTRIENVANIGIAANDGSNSFVQIENSRIFQSKFGVLAGNGTKVVFHNSVSSLANTAGLIIDGTGNMFIDGSVVSFNTTGITVNSGGQVAVANTDIVYNTNGTSGPTNAQSYVNNRCFGNSCSLSPISGSVTNPQGQQ